MTNKIKSPGRVKLLLLAGLTLLGLMGCTVRIHTGSNQWDFTLGSSETPRPTYTANPTYTPLPTFTPRPTYTPLPAYTLQPTYTYGPSVTPTPFLTAKPTNKTPATSTSAKLAVPTAGPGEISQFARSVTASSQYGSSSWSASQAAGAPNTATCGDHSTAWASKLPNSVDWLEAEFETLVAPTRIIIYQTYHPGAITRVEVQNFFGLTLTPVYQATASITSQCPGRLEIEVKDINFYVNRIRITIDQSSHNGYAEIDAVQLIGKIK